MNSRIPGFTLLEMLITLAIFSVLGLAAHGSLQQVLSANQVSEQRSEALAELQWAFGQLQRDVEQVVVRPYRHIDGERVEQALSGGPAIAGSELDGLTLLRAGWSNPAGLLARSDLQPVSYLVDQGKLVRNYYPYPDTVTGTEARSNILLSGLTLFELGFFDGQRWQRQWSEALPPKAVRVRLELAGWDSLERLFLLPAPGGNHDDAP